MTKTGTAKVRYIQEPAKQIPVLGEYDVIVCGGGVAGISAALASQRAGAKTLLLEKSFLLGGLATAGLVAIYLPLCDGNGTQVSFSLAEELLKLSIQHGAERSRSSETDIEAWLADEENEEIRKRRKNSRYRVQFNPNLFAILCERLLLDAGVKIVYGDSLCNAVVEEGKIQAVICENKNGRHAWRAKSFIDATGDADLCWYAGEETDVYQNGNVLAYWYYGLEQDELRLHMLGGGKQENGQDVNKRYLGLDGEEITEFLSECHKNIATCFLSDGGVSKTHSIATIASMPQLRMTRKLVGAYSLDVTEERKTFADSVGLFSNWKKRGPVYELPFSCLHGKKIKNLYACGRCISVSQETWDITRVIPVCAVSGEAVGICSAIFEDITQVDIGILQEKLLKNGVKLHIEDVLQ